MKKLVTLLLVSFLGLSTFGQFASNNKWSYSVFIGASNMLSDLGGSDYANVAGYRDVNLEATQPAFGLGIQRHVNRLTFSGNVMATRLIANDQFSNIDGRALRNLRVRTDLIEANALIEVLPFGSSPMPVMRNFYASTGLGLMYFEPKTDYNGEWINLQPLGTEGQNYLSNTERYNRIGLVIPIGFGYKFPIGKFTTVKLDYTMRKTFTDYLDDVSTVYADPSSLVSSSGEIAAILADRSYIASNEGDKRGNSASKDFYFTFGVKISKTLGRKAKADCNQLDIPRKGIRIQ